MLPSRVWARASGLGLLLGISSAHAADPEPEPPEGIEVTVTGAARPPTASRDPTAASTVLRRDALDSPGASSADVLERVPGVEISHSGGGADLATASLRGASAAQTPVYLAGVRLNDDVTGTADLSTIPLYMLHRVEVYRGNAPAAADRLGLGGALFFEPALPVRDEVRAGQLVGSYGSLGTWVGGSVAGRRSAALLSVRRDSAEGDAPYLDDRGTLFDTSDDREVRRVNADHRSLDLWAIGRYQLGGGSEVLALVNSFAREQGQSGLGVLPARHARADVKRQLFALSSRVSCAPGRVARSCEIELVSSALLATLAVTDPAYELGLQATELDQRGRRLSQRVGWRGRLGEAFDFGLSASQSVDLLDIARLGLPSGRAMRATSRGSARAEARVGETWLVHGLGAVESHATSGGDLAGNPRAMEPVGRIGVKVAALRWWSWLVNAGRYVRAPTLGELYGTSPLVVGNPALDSESGVSVDLGTRLSLAPARPGAVAGHLELFGFRRDARELIAFQRTSFGQIRPYNVGRARLLGLEAALGAEWLRLFEHRTALTVLDPRDTTPGRVLENDILPYHARLVVQQQWRIGVERPWAALPLERVAFGVEFYHRASRHQNPAGLGPVPSLTRWDAELDTRWLAGRLGVGLHVRDLLDARGFDAVGLPLPGRMVYGSAEVRAW